MTRKSLLFPLVTLALLLIAGSAQTAMAQVGFPDADATSGRFITIARGTATLGDPNPVEVINLSIQIPAGQPNFTIEIFDGDMGGNWDFGPVNADQLTYKLFRDPLKSGNTNPADLIWTIPSTAMTDNGWFATPTIPTDAGAQNVDGNFYYHLVADWNTTLIADEINSIKVRVNGQPFLLAGSTIGFIGFPAGGLIIPGLLVAPPSTYDGKFTFRFLVPPGGSLNSIDLFDGDADRADDTDDPNFSGLPPFPTSPLTRPEGVWPGNPLDDNIFFPSRLIPPNIFYSVIAPAAGWIRVNNNPSGDQEWELFRLMTAAAADGTQDEIVPNFPPGFYTFLFEGLDAFNNIFIHADFEIFPPPPPNGGGPGTGTQGYWKNHPQAWPVENIEIGCVTYTKAQAIEIMKKATKGDKTLNMFEQLVSAVLNVFAGNESSCILPTIAQAQAWMCLHPPGSGVGAGSAAWANEGGALHKTLDDYNNGRLCAPHRD